MVCVWVDGWLGEGRCCSVDTYIPNVFGGTQGVLLFSTYNLLLSKVRFSEFDPQVRILTKPPKPPLIVIHGLSPVSLCEKKPFLNYLRNIFLNVV